MSAETLNSQSKSKAMPKAKSKITKKVDHNSKEVDELRKKNAKLTKDLASVTRSVKAFKSNRIVAGAADEPISAANAVAPNTQGKITYAQSLLVPTDGCASIADELGKQHVIRSETVTHNVSLTPLTPGEQTVTGCFILYPNHPTDLIGYAFQKNSIADSDIEWTFLGKLTVAQNLEENYNYGRRVSCELVARSATLPSGLYAINGTMNAVRVVTNVSELSLDPITLYDDLLAATTNLPDKIGNVSVGDGITTVMVPETFGGDYSRLNDAIPTVLAVGSLGAGGTTHAQDLSDSMRYWLPFDCGNSLNNMPSGQNVTILDTTYDIDATVGIATGLTVRGHLVPANMYVSPTSARLAATFTFTYADPFGNIVYQYTYSDTLSKGGDSLDTTDDSSDFSHFSQHSFNLDDLELGTDNDGGGLETDSLGPVAAVRVTIVAFVPVAGDSTGNVFAVEITHDSLLANRPGVVHPVTIIAYQDVAAGSTMVLSGVANFELIPNQDLMKNLPTIYPYYEPKEYKRVRKLLARRDLFGIRTVYNAVQFNALKPTFRELANLPKAWKTAKASGISAAAFGFGDIVKRLKQTAGALLPSVEGVISHLVPEAQPFISLGNAITNGVAATAASGAIPQYMVRGLSASEPLVGSPLPPGSDLSQFGAMAAGRTKRTRVDRKHKRLSQYPINGLTAPVKLYGTMYPVVNIEKASGSIISSGIYMVCDYDAAVIKQLGFKNVCKTLDGHLIYGYNRENIHLSTGKDLMLVPLDYGKLRGGHKVFDLTQLWPQTEMDSCEGAIWVHCHCTGKFDYVITGAVSLDHGVPYLCSNPFFEFKSRTAHEAKLKIAANDPRADLPIKALREIEGLKCP